MYIWLGTSFFASVLKVFEGVGAIWEGPDGAPPGLQGGPRPPPQNTTISLRHGAFGVQCTRAVGAAHILVYRSDRQQLMSGMSTGRKVCNFAHFAITGVCSFHWPALYLKKVSDTVYETQLRRPSLETLPKTTCPETSPKTHPENVTGNRVWGTSLKL